MLPEGYLFLFYFGLIYDLTGVEKWFLRWVDTSVSYVQAESYSLVSSLPPLPPYLEVAPAILPCSKSFLASVA